MFTRSAAFYDAVYAGKDYLGEAERVSSLIRAHRRTNGNTLLDVACGTGGHLAYFKHHYAAEGLDLDPNLLAIARQRHPELRFHQADRIDFELGRTFDAVVCLFSAILEFHYLVGTAEGVDRFTERHELGLFTQDEYCEAAIGAGLVTSFDENGLTGRGLLIGVRPFTDI